TVPAVPLSLATMSTVGYTFVYEAGQDLHLKVEGHSTTTHDGEGKRTDLEENIAIRYAGHTFQILNGKLTSGSKYLGEVKPGDRITLTISGEVSVNGIQR
ncbi:MAG TPA: hypothetical protein PKA06_07170, partial [Gemmatales bacterium]|nr:hypothetical protein [Gemmatales bacterium]